MCVCVCVYVKFHNFKQKNLKCIPKIVQPYIDSLDISMFTVVVFFF